MKYVSIILVVLLAALISWGMFEITQHAEVQIGIGVISFLAALIPPAVAVFTKQEEYPRSNMLIKSTSAVVFVLLLIVNGVFAFLATSLKPVIMTDGVVLLLYLFSVLKVYNSKQ